MIPWALLMLGASLLGDDPTHDAKRIRRLECQRVDVDTIRRERKGLLQKESPRGNFFEETGLLCAERIMRPGERSIRDEAILGKLTDMSESIASTLSAHHPSVVKRSWLVEVHYPSSAVAAKITFAAKNSLMDRGMKVSDRVPTLAVGDIRVLAQTPPAQAYALACKRYVASNSLGPNDAVLGISFLDPRETILHAGMCVDGLWSWLQ